MTKKTLLPALLVLLLGALSQNIFAQASGTKPELIMYRHNSSPGGNSPTPVVANDILGTLRWKGLTEIGQVRTGASIQSVTKQVAPGFLRANLIFSTSANASAPYEPYQRMIITEDGLVGIGTMAPQYHLDVIGNTHTSGRFYGRIHFDNNSTADDAPNTYTDEAYFERKNRSVLTVPAAVGVNDFGGILSLAPGGGAYDHQLFFGQDGIWNRRDVSNAAAWTAPWEKLLSSSDIKGRPNLVARFLPPDSPSSKIGDGQVFDNGANVVIGEIPAGPNPVPVFVATDVLTVNGNNRVNGNVRVTGDVAVTGTTATNALIVANNAAAGSLNVLNNSTTGSLNVVNNATTGSLTVNTTSQLTGNVGIGTASTTYKLDVNGESNFRDRVRIGANNFTTLPDFKLAVGGGIIAEEVRVQIQPWPDYVFDQNYDLKPLAEVEQYVRENKHLPGVVAAADVAVNGLDLGQTQKIQMEKIEELYLHLIALEKRVNVLEAENASLKATIEKH